MADVSTRLLPNWSLPPYAFVPGRNPHPTSDPAGHSFGKPRPAPEPVDPSRWGDCREYLFGLDLFNHGYYWEAHEAWEGLWNAAGRRGEVAEFLKALIHLGAAGVKAREGRAEGVRSHARRAAELFGAVSRRVQAPRFLGLDVTELARRSAAAAESPPMPDRHGDVEIVFDTPLVPE